VVCVLLKGCKPINTITNVEMHQKLNIISMKKGRDPDRLLEQLKIEEQYSIPDTKIYKSYLIAIEHDVARQKRVTKAHMVQMVFTIWMNIHYSISHLVKHHALQGLCKQQNFQRKLELLVGKKHSL
jgi:hypothetical protein